MYAFNYHRPASVADAAALLSANPDAKFMAGGQTLLPAMKLRLANPSDVVDLVALRSDLSGIRREGDRVVIGALARHGEIATSGVLEEAIPALAGMAAIVGDPAVRARGTMGGSLANNDPAADYPAAALALGATIVTDRREIAADDYFRGLFETALQEGEIITAIAWPIPKRAGYEKFRNPASRYAMVGVFVAERADGEVRVAVTGAGASGVFRARDLEAALKTDFSEGALHGVSVSPDGLNSDMHADAEYRAHLVGVMARRAVKAAVG